jgi:ornithine--oxo-acid transaminase
MVEQAGKLTLTSRAFHNDQLAPFYEQIAELTGSHKVLPMNSGAEAVESAIKSVRKWGYEVKGVPDGQAEVIVCADNFHGRTLAIIGFSTDAAAREHFGPFAPGFKIIPFGNAKALEEAITPNTVAFLVEPIQGEAGIVIPPPGYFAKVRELCTAHDVMLILDEIQTGLGRTGKLLAEQHDGIEADVTLLGKALSGGFYPVSAVLSNNAVLGTLKPGQHGSDVRRQPARMCRGAGSPARACRGRHDRERGRPRRALPRRPKEHPRQHDPRGARTRVDVSARASPGSR